MFGLLKGRLNYRKEQLKGITKLQWWVHHFVHGVIGFSFVFIFMAYCLYAISIIFDSKGFFVLTAICYVISLLGAVWTILSMIWGNRFGNEVTERKILNWLMPK